MSTTGTMTGSVPSSATRSNPVTFVSRRIDTLRGLLFTNNRIGTVAVATFVSCVNISGSVADSIVICRNIGVAGVEAGFWSGYVGQGKFDRFALTCEVAMNQGETLGWLLSVGQWDVVVTGYYCPAVILSPQQLPGPGEQHLSSDRSV